MSWVEATVRASSRIGPHLQRITLTGEGVRGYRAEGLADDYCRVLFPDPGRERPVIGRTGPDPEQSAPMRNYTIRRLDRTRGEIDLDFVLHGRGVAADWARQAAPGRSGVALSPAFGSYRPPAGAVDRLLVTDLSGLPAAGRILAEAAPDERFRVVGIVPGNADELPLTSPAALDLRWLHVPFPGQGAALARAVVDQVAELPADTYVWGAGESAGCRAARNHLWRVLRRPPASTCVFGYWKARTPVG